MVALAFEPSCVRPLFWWSVDCLCRSRLHVDCSWFDLQIRWKIYVRRYHRLPPLKKKLFVRSGRTFGASAGAQSLPPSKLWLRRGMPLDAELL